MKKKQHKSENVQIDPICEESNILYYCLRQQKNRMYEDLFQQRLSFALHGSERQTLKNYLDIIAQISIVSEECIIACHYKRALHFMCILSCYIDTLVKLTNSEYEKIQKSFFDQNGGK